MKEGNGKKMKKGTKRNQSGFKNDMQKWNDKEEFHKKQE